MPDISIRAGQADDIETIAQFVHALLEELSDGKAPPLARIMQSAAYVLAEENVVSLIAEMDDVAVGVIVLNECAAIYAGGRFGEISELYVQPKRRSQGVAAKLLAAAQNKARTREWTRLEVGAPTQPEWQRSLRFYMHHGFEEVGPRLRKLL